MELASLRPDKGGFVTDITNDQLKGAAVRSDDWSTDRAWEQRTFDYYGAPYYWL